MSDMMPAKDAKGTYFCISSQDVFDVVFVHKPLLCSNRLKFGMVFFDVFVKSLVQHNIDCKALESTNFLNFCFEGTGIRQPLLRALHNAQHLYPVRIHDRRSRRPGSPCREH